MHQMNDKITSRIPRVQQTVLQFEEFVNPFQARLRKDNKWVIRAGLIPWETLEAIHEAERISCETSETNAGRPEIPFRMAFGSLLVKELLGCTDRETVEAISENPYIQFFLGIPSFTIIAPFHASSMVEFRKRFSDTMIRKANEALVTSRRPEIMPMDVAPENAGTLIVDATCAPEDMRYPTDIALLNDVRTFTEAFVTYLWHSSALARTAGEKIPRTYRREACKEFLSVVRKRKIKENELRRGVRKQIGYCSRNLRHIESMLGRMDDNFALKEKHALRLELAKRIVAQQEELLAMKKGKDGKRASIPERIVSFFKPYVRPIVRGKAAHPTEFGAKLSLGVSDGFVYLDHLSWNAFHEGADLPRQAVAYKDRTGHYPARILCDKAYHSRDNRQWCKERGIVLGAPPVGRPPLDPVERKNVAREVRQNELDRIEVEGKFGVAKRRFSLDRVMTRLRECSECVISLVFMAINLEKLVRLLFVPIVFFIQKLILGAILHVDEDYSASKRWLAMA